jgi:branched-chain amino acid transport system permease protein
MLYRENGQFKTSYRADQQIFPIRRTASLILLLLAFAFVGVPLLASEYLFRAILIPFLILSLAALGLNILVGYCGQISLGTGAFMAVGAYAAYNFFVRIDGMPVVLAILLGGVCSTVVGVLFGIPSAAHQGPVPGGGHAGGAVLLRLGLPAHQVVHQRLVLGLGQRGRPELFGWKIDTPVDKYLFCLGFVVVFALLAKNLVRSHIGREWMAMRDMDVAASVIGIRPVYAKLTAFAVSSFIVGVAGALWGFVHLGSWEPAAFNIDRSFQTCCSWSSSAAWVRSWAASSAPPSSSCCRSSWTRRCRRWARWSACRSDTAPSRTPTFMIFGALIVFFLIVEPHGLARLWSIGKEKLRLWPFPH